MKKLFCISLLLGLTVSVDANAINKYRKTSNKPSVEVNLIALRYLTEDVYAARTPSPVAAKPVAAPIDARRSPRLQSEQKTAVSAPPKKAPKQLKPKIETKPEPKKIEAKIPEPKLEMPKFTPPAPPAPALVVPPLPSFIKEESKPAPIPAPKKIEPKLEVPKFEAPKFTPPPPPLVKKEIKIPEPVAIETPKFEPIKVKAPEIEIPKFEAPEIPKPPSIPEISADEEVITVPSLPSLEKEISATNNQRTVILPPPVFDEVKAPNVVASNSSAGLPSVSELFGEAPKPPVPSIATNDEPKSLIGKPALETVKLQPQALPSTSQLPISSETPAMSVPFTEAEVDFPLSEKANLLEIAATMHSDPSLITIIEAYASGTPDQASYAKRITLSRALNVRTLFRDRDIGYERIIIRPKGNTAKTGVPDRVDIFLTKKDGA